MNKRWDAKQICDILIVWMSLILLKFLIKQSSIQSLSCVQLFVNSWTAIHQASLSITNSWSLLKLMFIESLMPSNHLILCHPILLPSVFPSIKVFSSQFFTSGGWSIGVSASASVLPMNIQDWFPNGCLLGLCTWSLAGCRPWGHKESDTTKWLNNHHNPHLGCDGSEGNCWLSWGAVGIVTICNCAGLCPKWQLWVCL